MKIHILLTLAIAIHVDGSNDPQFGLCQVCDLLGADAGGKIPFLVSLDAGVFNVIQQTLFAPFKLQIQVVIQGNFDCYTTAAKIAGIVTNALKLPLLKPELLPLKLFAHGKLWGDLEDFFNCMQCFDHETGCAGWAYYGYCENNATATNMKVNCPVSCKVCNETCRDWDSSCTTLAANGTCATDPAHMLTYCKKSCNYCNNCTDLQHRCPYYAKYGQCQSNANSTHFYCRASCNLCSKKLL